jgi:hypothetical protein
VAWKIIKGIVGAKNIKTQSYEGNPFWACIWSRSSVPVEKGLQSLRMTGQGSLLTKEYHELMMDKINDVPKSRFNALEEIEKEKIKIAKAYNKRVMGKSFQVRDLVWKMILPLGTWSGKFHKWSPSWKGPFRVIWVAPGNAYFMEDIEGHSLPKALNGKYLKCYYPSMWTGGTKKQGWLRVIVRCKRERTVFWKLFT